MLTHQHIRKLFRYLGKSPGQFTANIRMMPPVLLIYDLVLLHQNHFDCGRANIQTHGQNINLHRLLIHTRASPSAQKRLCRGHAVVSQSWQVINRFLVVGTAGYDA